MSRNSCPSCGSRETFRVSMTLGGTETSFTSCPECEWKGWEREGENVPLGSVLSIVANH